MSDKFEYWLEAAYLYYIRPDLPPLMFDAQWDMMARQFEKQPPKHPLASIFIDTNNSKFNTAYFIKEEQYPEWIKEKYRDV